MAKQESETRIVTLVLGALLIFTAGIFLGQFLARGSPFGSKAPPEITESTPTPSAVVSSPTVKAKSIEEAGGVGDLPPKGEKDAPVTMIEFTEFQCPFSGSFARDTLPKIEEEYIKTGKVKFYFRDYPLSFHQYAQKAAEAARCANEQGRFWAYHDKVFENQEILSLENLKKWAVELGLVKGKFDSCLDEGKFEEVVKKDFADGQAAGVRGTPAFFINGRLFSGAQPLESFREAIEKALGET
jgi:protein-disulfide isomerase